jgi:hypothetical protein
MFDRSRIAMRIDPFWSSRARRGKGRLSVIGRSQLIACKSRR